MDIQALTRPPNGILFALEGLRYLLKAAYYLFILLSIFLPSDYFGAATAGQMTMTSRSSAALSRSAMDKKIYLTVKRKLPKKFQGSAHVISRAIIKDAAKYRLDPLIVTAVIDGESSFNPQAIGPVGEMGLMQLRPSTAKWISGMMKIPYQGDSSLLNPVVNIRIGMAYLSYLRGELDGYGTHVYLAAYNMGIGTVLKFLAKNIQPEIYSRHVMKRYAKLNQMALN